MKRPWSSWMRGRDGRDDDDALACRDGRRAGRTPGHVLHGTGPGWRALGEADFTRVNCDPDTWTWKDGDRPLHGARRSA